MTFTEAALEVLKSAGKPLHYKKITEIAIERNLLSHVGKTPELTMSARLATMVKMDRGDAPIVKVRPGVFAMRNSDKSQQKRQRKGEVTMSIPKNELQPQEDEQQSFSDSMQFVSKAEQSTPASIALPGSDVFPEEEDDDELILADFDQDDESAEEAKARKRRRRRRRSKDDDENDSGARNNATPTREHERSYGNSSESNSARRRPDNENHQATDWNRSPDDGELLGKDLADATWSVLMRTERRPVAFIRAAELLVRRGRLSGHAAALAPTIAAAIRADISRSEISGSRPRFRVRGNRVEITDWLLPRDVVRMEEAALRAAERQREQVRRGLIHKLNELPTGAFAEIVATWLNAEGVVSLRAVRRSGSSGTQLHFAGTLKRGVEETRLAIVVQRNGRGIDRERVIDVRGALHHYGNASSAWLVSTSRAIDGAREEAATGATPCVIFDGIALAEAMERLGIGVKRHTITITNIDFDLFDSLGDRNELRVRNEMDRERERDRGRRSRRGRGREDAGYFNGESRSETVAEKRDDFSFGHRDSRPEREPDAVYGEVEEETACDRYSGDEPSSTLGLSAYRQSDLSEISEAQQESAREAHESSAYADEDTFSREYDKNGFDLSKEDDSARSDRESDSLDVGDFDGCEPDDNAEGGLNEIDGQNDESIEKEVGDR
ncbi:MAG: restriction endonuclease [Deltaproteobacteria bacterium]|nr:restriction endonuclease [Deltaproteobacteria bacterium]